ncbi:conserved hypothetical protein [Talaromyces stipitatus ATCC 10500]|uniref:Uncharacterized protein n=1 Tax=Talaromyces stipitatus (strain ATCC 10500 / CBS 375.48 / QM 6759 / NRRL 1006) TaxID=441959 RepID=B8MDP5_TALSN|nr:uncharacterized protein TSTA_120240 [Talaromyces stipitatus ATCC 10500]EED18274.1 conserved hypothetical protein [Talaromyces stipitatus ATCC 10500]
MATESDIGKGHTAVCNALLIRRNEIADRFWNDMEEPDHALVELAFEVFDRYGCIQPKFKNHPIKWGFHAIPDLTEKKSRHFFVVTSPKIRFSEIGHENRQRDDADDE